MALQYMQDKIPNLISRVELWVQSGAGTAGAEQKQAVRVALDQLEASVRQVSKWIAQGVVGEVLKSARNSASVRPRSIRYLTCWRVTSMRTFTNV